MRRSSVWIGAKIARIKTSIPVLILRYRTEQGRAKARSRELTADAEKKFKAEMRKRLRGEVFDADGDLKNSIKGLKCAAVRNNAAWDVTSPRRQTVLRLLYI